jgi:predicted nucleotidyltransferase
MDEANVVDQIRDRIVAGFRPLKVVLFGSRAVGLSHPGSDVDVLVVVESAPDKRALAIDMRRAVRDVPVAKDIIVTTPEEIARRGDMVGSVLRSALRAGKVIFERA